MTSPQAEFFHMLYEDELDEAASSEENVDGTVGPGGRDAVRTNPRPAPPARPG